MIIYNSFQNCSIHFPYPYKWKTPFCRIVCICYLFYEPNVLSTRDSLGWPSPAYKLLDVLKP